MMGGGDTIYEKTKRALEIANEELQKAIEKDRKLRGEGKTEEEEAAAAAATSSIDPPPELPPPSDDPDAVAAAFMAAAAMRQQQNMNQGPDYDAWAVVINDKFDREEQRHKQGLPADPWEEEMKPKPPTPEQEQKKKDTVAHLMNVFRQELKKKEKE